MNNEQLTKEVIELKEKQIIDEMKTDNAIKLLEELKEDFKATKTLAEDVHIMAINMKNMQETSKKTNQKVDDLSQKVDSLSEKDFKEYKENKKLIKDKVIGTIGGSIGTIILGLIIWAIKNFT